MARSFFKIKKRGAKSFRSGFKAFPFACVTLLMNTHRTSPENLKDPIVLRNLCKKAEISLHKKINKPLANLLSQNLYSLAENIDHTYHLDSLMLLTNSEFKASLRLPLKVKERITIGQRFDLRDLIRHLEEQTAYYILVLCQKKARLIEGLNDQFIEEKGDPFPLNIQKLFPRDRLNVCFSQKNEYFTENFFNQVDKAVQFLLSKKPLPLLICSDERNYFHYLKVANKTDWILGHIPPTKARDVYKDATYLVSRLWPSIQKMKEVRRLHRLDEVAEAVNSGNFFTDLNDIWQALKAGKGRTLMVEENYFQPARRGEAGIKTLTSFEFTNSQDTEDIIDEMIALTLSEKGEVIFLPEGSLEKFKRIFLIPRY